MLVIIFEAHSVFTPDCRFIPDRRRGVAVCESVDDGIKSLGSGFPMSAHSTLDRQAICSGSEEAVSPTGDDTNSCGDSRSPLGLADRAGVVAARRESAFTLVELLAVLAILVLLFAVIVPALGGMGERASRAKCASNLRQCGASLLAYASDHNGQLPAPTGRSYPDSFGNLVQLCRPYFTDFSIWGCPEMRAAPIDDPGNTSLFRCSYQYYANTISSTPPKRINSGRLAALGARTLLMQDNVYSWGGKWRCTHSSGGVRTTSTPSNPSFTLYFEGVPKGFNVLYGDGSLKWVPFREDMQGLQWIYKAGDYTAPTSDDVVLQ